MNRPTLNKSRQLLQRLRLTSVCRYHNQASRRLCSSVVKWRGLSTQVISLTSLNPRSRQFHESKKKAIFTTDVPVPSFDLNVSGNSTVPIQVDGHNHHFSAILLRDLCQCPECVHESTNQKLYSTADIPPNIKAKSFSKSPSHEEAVDIIWDQDIPGFEASHTTSLPIDTLRSIIDAGTPVTPFSNKLSPPVNWDADSSDFPDIDFEAYMKDDLALLRAIEQLQTYGLVFLTNVPGEERSVSAIAERIGPVKDTFYGHSWDVRTVPKAINAAYTSNDLGFHTDLLYFENPPHIQLLHCIQSSSVGGASVFADAFKCAVDLYETDIDAFNILATTLVNYHYKHPDSNLYKATKPVFDMRPLRIGNVTYRTLPEFLMAWKQNRTSLKSSIGAELPLLGVVDCLEKINWGPPFLAPFSFENLLEHAGDSTALESLNNKVDEWHAAARKFAALLDRPEILHERLMQPGECVLFNNTRVLHSRRAFNSSDVGKARWLRGTYVDKDPFFSKLRVLSNKYRR